MLFPGWEVRIVKNCDRGLENGTFFQAKVTVFHSIQTNPKLVNIFNKFFFFQALKRKKKN